MNKHLLLCLLLTSSALLNTTAQSCLPDGITFSTQGQVDSFFIHFPGCTEMEGPMIISGETITNLHGLEGLRLAEDTLLIQNNPLLQDLRGLDSLRTASRLFIRNNESLSSLSGLGRLDSVRACFSLTENPELANLSGLERLSYVGQCQWAIGVDERYSSGFVISTNASLHSLSGLENLGSTGCFTISNNPMLVSLAGLESLSTVGTCSSGQPLLVNYRGFSISQNLSLASLDGLENLNSVDWLRINSNPALASLEALDSLSEVANLTIRDNYSLPSLNGLQGLDTLESLTISDNPSLATLSELSGLRFVGNLMIDENDGLRSLDGLQNLPYIEAGLFLTGNDSLATLNGLENLDSLGGCLVVSDNDALTSLIELTGLTSIGTCGGFRQIPRMLVIQRNPSLASLSGLDNIHLPETGELYIQDCPNLSVCEVQSLCDYFNGGGEGEVSGNASGCNSVAEIEAACLASAVHEERKNGDPIRISPNPATGFIRIQFPENISGPLALQIFDTQGRLVQQKKATAGQKVTLERLARGLYVVKGVAGNEVYVGKFVKE